MSTMNALITQGDGAIAVQSTTRPTPGPGEVLVKVHYAAQNPGDFKTVYGAAPVVPPAPPGFIVGCDFAGTIEDPNGSSWSQGQRVAGFVMGTSPLGTPSNPVRGAFAEYVPIESSLLFAVPDEVGLKDAATIPVALATSMQALYQRLALPEKGNGQWLLVYGGATSVGSYAIQLGKLRGFKVITTASPKNHDHLKSLGADAVVDYRGDWVQDVKQVTEGKLKYAFDCVSEKGSTINVAKTLSRSHGDHIVILTPADPQTKQDIGQVNPHAKVEWTVVFTVFERALPFSGLDNCGGETPQDKRVWENYLGLLPDLLKRGEIKPNQSRELGGLESVAEGFKLAAESKVSNEKLVYKILKE